jgi:hypothetical protein
MAVSATTRLRVQCVLLAPLLGCTTIDPGPNYVVADVTFDASYFYCHIEPAFIFANKCGPGDPSLDTANSCHFNPSAVSGMPLIDHPAVDCAGGDSPVDMTEIGTGSPAQSNYVSVAAEMSRSYTSAPLLVRPSGHSHPRAVISATDPTVDMLLATWAQ